MWIQYNPNPVQGKAIDCSVRAVSKALNTDWESAYALIANNGFMMGDMMVSNAVWGSVLRQHGFKREIIPNECPDCYTLEDFAAEHQNGTYVVVMSGHVATVLEGHIYDAWDSSHEKPLYYWVKEEK